ncbi:hypothetical protein AAG570_010693 [Ranatra chinensis]|uniref:Uncharacterized protein n=1 Tax=Ranatra chinensis TaxID=642074 RepID=A0ABD0YNS8_9HEMI
MASKRRNMFHKNKTQETTEKGRNGLQLEVAGRVRGHYHPGREYLGRKWDFILRDSEGSLLGESRDGSKKLPMLLQCLHGSSIPSSLSAVRKFISCRKSRREGVREVC